MKRYEYWAEFVWNSQLRVKEKSKYKFAEEVKELPIEVCGGVYKPRQLNGCLKLCEGLKKTVRLPSQAGIWHLIGLYKRGMNLLWVAMSFGLDIYVKMNKVANIIEKYGNAM